MSIAYDSDTDIAWICSYCNKLIKRYPIFEDIVIIGKGQISLKYVKGMQHKPVNFVVRHKRCQQQAQANKANWGQAR